MKNYNKTTPGVGKKHEKLMTDSIELIQRIGREGQQVDRYIKEDIAQLRESMEPLLCDILAYGLLSGGKRIRPLLVLVAARL